MSETKTAVGLREITVITTNGEKKVIETDVTKFKDLKPLLISNGYSLSNMKVVESVNRTTLEHVEATLPPGNFKVYLLPYKSKSGAAAKKAAPKKAIAKKAVAKKAAPKKAAKKTATKAAKPAKVAKEVLPPAPPAPEQSKDELRNEVKELAGGFNDVRI
jgi:hypothetical protein